MRTSQNFLHKALSFYWNLLTYVFIAIDNNSMLEKNPVNPIIEKRIKDLDNIRKSLVLSLSKAPEGSLREESRGPYFYYVKGNKKVYLNHKEHKLIKALAKKAYDMDMLSFIDKRLKALKKFLKDSPEDIDSVYEKLSPGRKSLVESYTISQDYIDAWQQQDYERWDVQGIESENSTSVRSKSEEMIADFLTHNNIPFRYEMKCNLKNAVYRPDFTCLNRRTGATILWEHFGMMDDCDYVHKTTKKLNDYALSGYVLGTNLIATFESGDFPLSSKILPMYLPLLT